MIHERISEAITLLRLGGGAGLRAMAEDSLEIYDLVFIDVPKFLRVGPGDHGVCDITSLTKSLLSLLPSATNHNTSHIECVLFCRDHNADIGTLERSLHQTGFKFTARLFWIKEDASAVDRQASGLRNVVEPLLIASRSERPLHPAFSNALLFPSAPTLGQTGADTNEVTPELLLYLLSLMLPQQDEGPGIVPMAQYNKDNKDNKTQAAAPRAKVAYLCAGSEPLLAAVQRWNQEGRAPQLAGTVLDKCRKPQPLASPDRETANLLTEPPPIPVTLRPASASGPDSPSLGSRKYAAVGVLGGMGPAATVDFFGKLVAGTPASQDQEHLPVIVHSVPQIPDRSASFLSGTDSPEPLLVEFAQRLEAGGAAVIVIPCNTAHLWHEPVAQSVQIPVLHIVDPVIKALLREKGRRALLRVGLLGTTATAESGLYPRRCAQKNVEGLEWMLPSTEEQIRLVSGGIQAVKAGKMEEGGALLLEAADSLLARGAEVVVQACTEIPLVLGSEKLPVPAVDATQLLADATVRWALRRRLTESSEDEPELGMRHGSCS